MIFSTYTYAAFLGIVFAVHWLSPRAFRPWILIAASYLFYATWQWQVVSLLIAVTVFNWSYARFVLCKDEGRLWPGIAVNLAVLVVFKYLDFIIGNTAAFVRILGLDLYAKPFALVLPLGVSFFTFQGVAYLVDVASGEKPFLSLRNFMLYKSFWPQLIAGPIVRPGEIREQIESARAISYADVSEGARRILRGAFKKMVLADSLAPHVDLAFLGPGSPHFLDTVAGSIGFGLQIYFDFSAYSDFAIGSARLFGFHFPENFEWPYVAKSPQEFWNRWHMTLSRWIRDYLFTPMSFALRERPSLRPLLLIVAMALCGLWHGAEWTFVLWGIWHGFFLAAQQTALKSMFFAKSRLAAVVQWTATMLVVFAGWLIFRSQSLDRLWLNVTALLTFRGGFHSALVRENGILTIAILGLLTLGVSLLREPLKDRAASLWEASWLKPWLRPAFYAAVLTAIIVLDQEAKAFVYFQF